jgi:hypothetical protein
MAAARLFAFGQTADLPTPEIFAVGESTYEEDDTH